MFYTRDELDWIEREWAFHLYGRSAFMSRDDFLQLQDWANDGVPADVIVNAIGTYFNRRNKRTKRFGFVTLSFLSRDILKAMKLRSAIGCVDNVVDSRTWDLVKEPARSDLQLKYLYDNFKRIQLSAPLPDAPDFLDHFALEQRAAKDLITHAEQYLILEYQSLRQSLADRLLAAKILEDTIIWDRAWEHHWMRIVCTKLEIPL